MLVWHRSVSQQSCHFFRCPEAAWDAKCFQSSVDMGASGVDPHSTPAVATVRHETVHFRPHGQVVSWIVSLGKAE